MDRTDRLLMELIESQQRTHHLLHEQHKLLQEILKRLPTTYHATVGGTITVRNDHADSR